MKAAGVQQKRETALKSCAESRHINAGLSRYGVRFKTRDVVSAPGRVMRITTIYNIIGFRYDPAEINDQSQMPRRLWSLSAARLRLRALRATSLPQVRGAGHLALVPFSSLFRTQF